MRPATQILVDRPLYLENLLSWRDKPDVIKIVTGIRRCGKSTLFQMFRSRLVVSHGVMETQIQEINFEDADFSDLLDWKKLHEHIKSRLVPDKMNYIFLDEIQNVPNFEKTVNSLRLRGNADIYITGSNSRILSGELATLLSGRYITIHIQPFSFKEYMSAYSVLKIGALSPRNLNPGIVFQDYLFNSSFPSAAQLLAWTGTASSGAARLESEQVRQFLGSIFDTIVLKDIVERKGVKDVSRLKKVIKFIFDNIGSETSIRNIKNTLESDNGIKIDADTIENYLDGLMDAFVVYKIGRYDIKGKQHLKTNAKYYVADIGLRYLLLGREGDSGHILENIIFLELLRRGYNVSIGKINAHEVDFVAVKNGSTEYYQAAHEVSDKTTRDRELRALDAIDNHNPKFLLTMDNPLTQEYKGIKIINALDWLLA